MSILNEIYNMEQLTRQLRAQEEQRQEKCFYETRTRLHVFIPFFVRMGFIKIKVLTINTELNITLCSSPAD